MKNFKDFLNEKRISKFDISLIGDSADKVLSPPEEINSTGRNWDYLIAYLYNTKKITDTQASSLFGQFSSINKSTNNPEKMLKDFVDFCRKLGLLYLEDENSGNYVLNNKK